MSFLDNIAGLSVADHARIADTAGHAHGTDSRLSVGSLSKGLVAGENLAAVLAAGVDSVAGAVFVSGAGSLVGFAAGAVVGSGTDLRTKWSASPSLVFLAFLSKYRKCIKFQN